MKLAPQSERSKFKLKMPGRSCGKSDASQATSQTSGIGLFGEIEAQTEAEAEMRRQPKQTSDG